VGASPAKARPAPPADNLTVFTGSSACARPSEARCARSACACANGLPIPAAP